MSLLTSKERSFLFNESPFLKDLPRDLIAKLIAISNVVTYPKNGFVTRLGDNVDDFLLIISGLIRVNACSSSGRQITFLLVKAGEPYNMLSPYMKSARFLEATALEKTRCLWTTGKEFKKFVADHPPLATRMLEAIGGALDGANSKILGLLEKNVEERIMRVLSTLHAKFGSPLLFTSREIADIAGTTTESTLRSMANLRDMDIIDTQRGKIWVRNPEALQDIEFGFFTI
ncbi:Crp/Fnr family transcriptional regulator [bacterium]|nr:Crp/Fnr family transcriptional regulator [bacterium]